MTDKESSTICKHGMDHGTLVWEHCPQCCDDISKSRTSYEAELNVKLTAQTEVIEKCRELIKEYQYSLWVRLDEDEEENVCPDCGTKEDKNHQPECSFGITLAAIESLGKEKI